ncbi:MAG: hypothetical protein JXB49_06680, partial [Bacteroidales bacterium]|nr:hypothetical protein [Bacteroidales bacterium]
IILLMMIFAYPRIMNYYQSGKSNAKEIVSTIISEDITEGKLLVMPGYETKIYEVYFKYYFQKDNIEILSTTLDDLDIYEKSANKIYLVLPIKNYDHNKIISNGYKPVVTPESVCSGLRVLYSKSNN